MLLQTYIYIVPFDVFTKIKHPFLVPWKNVLLASPGAEVLFRGGSDEKGSFEWTLRCPSTGHRRSRRRK